MSFFKQLTFMSLSFFIFLSPTWAMEKEDPFYSMEGDIFNSHRKIAKGPDDFQNEADKLFPDKTKVFSSTEELLQIFEPIMHPEVTEIFKKYFNVIFDEKFPKPIHPNKIINEGFLCLLKKMLCADRKKEPQLEALFQLLALPGHKKLITQFNLTLGNDIPDFPCESCLKTAKTEFGISYK